MKRKAIALIALLFIGLLAVTSLSRSGRQWFQSVTGFLKVGNAQPISITAVPLVQGAPTIEEAARTAHGWSSAIVNSVVLGKITYYDSNGRETSNGSLILYRKYPDLLRVEITIDDITEVNGVDETGAWTQGSATLDETDARDIRALLRSFPDRLFVERHLDAPYREVGRHYEDYLPAAPGRGRVDLETTNVFDQVEVVDTINIKTPDVRRLYYYIKSGNSYVSAVHYGEPEDPNADTEDPETEQADIRIDFDNWHTVNNVLWPFDITHWYGGKVDYRITVTQVSINQNLSNNLFQRP